MKPSNIIKQLENRQPSILGHERYREFAILLPLIESEKGTEILFEIRSMNLRSQPGDICFPGGKIDKGDQGPLQAAVRETSEEIGIPESDITDVIPLDYMVSDFGRIIYPFVGMIKQPRQMIPNPDEVEETFTVPLSFFLQTKPEKYKVDFQVVPEESFPFERIKGGENYKWHMHQMDELFYEYEEKVIWGLTAKILTHFIDLLEES